MEDIKIDVPQNKNLSKVINTIGEIKINSNNIIQSLHSIMEAVENVDKTLKGADKKNLAIEVINCLIDKHSDISEDDKILLKIMVSQVVPQTIDVIVKVGNGLSELVLSTSKCFCF